MEELAQRLGKQKNWRAIKALTTVSNNLVDRPLDERVRTLRVANDAVQRNLLAFSEAREFLSLLGFVEVGDYLSIVGLASEARAAQAALEVAARKITPQKPDSAAVSSRSTTATPTKRGYNDAEVVVVQHHDEKAKVGDSFLGMPPLGLQRLAHSTITWQDLPSRQPGRRQLEGKAAPLGQTVLLYGPRGCGKGRVAHAAAKAWGLRILTVYGAEVVTPFAKGCQAQVRSFIRHSKEVQPCVLLLREMDPVLAEVLAEVSLAQLKRVVVMAISASGVASPREPSSCGPASRLSRTRAHLPGGRGGARDSPRGSVLEAFDLLVCIDESSSTRSACESTNGKRGGTTALPLREGASPQSPAVGTGGAPPPGEGQRKHGGYRPRAGRLAGLPLPSVSPHPNG